MYHVGWDYVVSEDNIIDVAVPGAGVFVIFFGMN